jgi:hypothetical protein
VELKVLFGSVRFLAQSTFSGLRLMPTLTQTTKDTVRRLLGYPVTERLGQILPQLNETYPQDSVDRISSILGEIVTIDSLRQESRRDSMALQIEEVKVSFNQHLNYLRSERQSLISELCQIVDLKTYPSMKGAGNPGGYVVHYQ